MWTTDGSASGTTLLKDINPGSASSIFSNLSVPRGSFLVIGNTLFFTANTAAAGVELWKTDGTLLGTVMVKDIYPGSSNGIPVSQTTADEYQFIELNGQLYFTAVEGTGTSPTREVLWKSDGSSQGTLPVFTGPLVQSPTYLAKSGSSIFFAAYYSNAPVFGTELFKYDGVSVSLVKKINPGGSSWVNGLVEGGNYIYFSANNDNGGGGTNYNKLWRTDGTDAGTVLVKDFASGYYPSSLLYSNAILFFSTTGGLWRSDGTDAGTFVLGNTSGVITKPSSTRSKAITSYNNNIYYTNYIGGTNFHYDVMKTDGTVLGTQTLVTNASGGNYKVQNNKLYFVDGFGGIGESDGTSLGTLQLVGGLGYNVGDYLFLGGNLIIGTAELNIFVAKTNQTITFATFPAKIFGDAAFTLAATASSSLAVTYTSSNPSVATISGNTVTIVGAGTSTITASQAGDGTFNAATNVTQTLTVNKADQTITFGAVANKTVGDSAFDLTATTTSGLPISFASSNTQVATIAGKTVTIVAAGTTNITASQSGNTNYNSATAVTQNFTVNPVADIVIKQNGTTIASGGAYDFGNVNMLANSGAITFTVTNPTSSVALVFDVVNSSLTGANASDFTVDYSTVGAGTSTIKFTPSASGVRTAQLSVVSNAKAKSPYLINLTGTGVKLSQTLTFNPLNPKSNTDTPFDLTATSTTTLPITYTSSNMAVATISGKTVTIVGVGTSTITASQAGDINYADATPVTQTLTVNTKQSQTVTFAALPTKKFGDAAFALTATASSTLAVTYASSNPNVATISGNTVTIVGAGTTNITASQAGNTSFNPATDVAQTLTVAKGDQTITFGTVAVKTLGDPAFTLGATTSSSLAVAYTTTSDKVTIAGSQVTLVAVGQASIKASQAGNASFNVAPDVTQTFCINPAKPTITISNGNTETPSLTSSATVGNQWYKNGTAIVGATNTTLSITAVGLYSVESTVETCKSARSSDFPIIVTGDIVPFTAKVLEISPNPTSDYIQIKLPGEGKKEIGIFNPNGALYEGTATEKNEITIDVHHYAAGQYLVRVSTATEIYYGKFIKK